MAVKSLILVVNPGSASRKYALFADGKKRAIINFEFEDGKVVGKVEYDDKKCTAAYDNTDLSCVSSYVLPLLRKYKIIGKSENLTAIGIRLVAPMMRFTKDELLTDDMEQAMEAIQKKAPLHVSTVLVETKQVRANFPGVPIVIISDSAFHSTKRECAWYYGVDIELADKYEIKRYGFHGISVGSVVRCLTEQNKLSPKTIVCHLGSGSSLTAVVDGKSFDTTMGFTPLEGLMMATRSGNMDISAALAIKHALNLSDEELEEYLNKKSGLIGVSGSSNDIRQLLTSEEKGDKKAKLALNLLVYRIQLLIGQMVASMGGVDSIVLTGTVGERSSIIRGRILDNLKYLGFEYDSSTNDKTFEPLIATNIAIKSSKPILVILTDEAAEIARRVEQYIKK
jgi:acetate kinase